MLLQMAIFHFLLLSNIPLCVYVYVCVCVCTPHLLKPIDGHLDCLHVLAIVNSAVALNIRMHESF